MAFRAGYPAIPEPRDAAANIRVAISNIRQRLDAVDAEASRLGAVLTQVGDGGAASIQALQVQLAALQARVTALEAAGGGTGGGDLALTALEAITVGWPISITSNGFAQRAKTDGSTREWSMVGVAVTGGAAGASVTVRPFGVLPVPGATFTAGQPVYVQADGSLSHTASILLAGVATATGSLFVDPDIYSIVALAAPAGELTVSGSPAGPSGTLTLSWVQQAPHSVFAGPSSGAPGTPTFRSLVIGDIPDLSSLYQPLDADLTAIAALTGTGIARRTAPNTWTVGGTVTIAEGGTGATTAAQAFENLSPLTTLGDMLYGAAAGVDTRLPGNTTTAKQFLSQTGTGTASAAPAWARIVTADVDVPVIGTPIDSNLEQFLNMMHSPGIITGGVLSTSGGNNLTISAGTAVLRIADDDVSRLYSVSFGPQSFAVPTDGFTRFYGLTYNAGSPTIVQRSTDTWDNDTEIAIGSAAYIVSAGALVTFTNPFKVGDPITNIIQRFDADARAVRDSLVGGLQLADAGSRAASLSAGKIWARLNDYNKTARNSSTAPLLAVSWGGTQLVLTPGLTQWPNTQYCDVPSGTLVTMANNKYACLWFFTSIESATWGFAYGTAQYNSIGDASLEGFPAYLTQNFVGQTLLVGRMIFQKSAAAASVVESAFTTNFVAAPVNNHNDLSGLQGGTTAQYYHLTAAAEAVIDTLASGSLVGRSTAGAGVVEAITVGSGLSLSGGTLSATAGGGGTVTSVGLSMPAQFSVAGSPVSTSGTLAVTWGNQLANTVLAGPTSGGSAAPTFRSLTSADIPNLSALYQPLSAELTALSGLSGTGIVRRTGVSAYSTGTTVTIAEGGTGQTTAAAAYNALSPMTTLGDIEYESGANTAARLPGNTTTTKQFLSQTGTGTASAAPSWSALAAGDIPNLGATYLRIDGTNSMAGNLDFSGTGRRITADFSNATQTNRLAFQTSTANGGTSVGAVPNGTATASNFIAWSSATIANASFLQYGIDSGAAQAFISSGALGSGTLQPLVVNVGGGQKLTIATNGQLSSPTQSADNTVSANWAGISIVGNSTVGYPAIGYNIASGNASNKWRFGGADNSSWVQFRSNSIYLFRSTNAPSTGGLITEAASVVIDGNGNTLAGADNAQTLGGPSNRWSVVYAGTGTINTSDARDKTEVQPFGDADIAASKQLAGEIGWYQFLAMVQTKGADAARFHCGMTVQRVIEIMQSHGLDALRAGFICYDKWDDEYEEIIDPEGDIIKIERKQATERRTQDVVEIKIQDGKAVRVVSQTQIDVPLFDTYELEGSDEPHLEPRMVDVEVRYSRKLVKAAGDKYSFRTDELLLFLARGFDARLKDLEGRLPGLGL